MSDFAFGVQPDKAGCYVLYERGNPVGQYPSPEAALNAMIVICRGRIANLRAEQRQLIDAIDVIKKTFGAPGDYGYESREGQALIKLYTAQYAASPYPGGRDE